jgi:hypothetical protein
MRRSSPSLRRCRDVLAWAAFWNTTGLLSIEVRAAESPAKVFLRTAKYTKYAEKKGVAA